MVFDEGNALELRGHNEVRRMELELRSLRSREAEEDGRKSSEESQDEE